jgi:arabinofuranosyltransferase
MRNDSVRTARLPVAGVAAALCAVFVLVCWVLRDFVTDDSWISVRYAENLASGAGAVWNPGGPRTEGFSNPLLVYVEAAAAAIGWDAMAAARAVGVLSGLGCVLLVTLGGRAVVGDAAAAVGGLLTAVSAPFALWAVGGLETTATAAALTAGVLQLARPDGGRVVLAGAVLALLPWLRPEGVVVALAVAGLAEGPGLLRRAARGRAVRRLAVVAGLPVLSQALLEVVRLTVYGHLLPNSVLYKSGTGETFGVLLRFVEHSQLVLALAAVGLLLLRRRALLLAVPALVYAAGSIGTKDSANSWSRFFMPVWPQLALLAGVALVVVAGLLVGPVGARLGRRPDGAAGSASHRVRSVPAGTAITTLLALAAGTGVALVLPGSVPEVEAWQGRYMGCRVAAREDAARWLTATPPDTLFAISDAGYVPARAGGRPAVDSFMLNDPLIQRTGPLTVAERADIVHERRPDVLVLASRDPDRFDPVYPTDRALREHPAAAAFTLRHVATGGDCGYHLMLLTR